MKPLLQRLRRSSSAGPAPDPTVVHDALIRLANNDHDKVRAMVRDLLRDRDPRKDVGLEAWGRLLGTPPVRPS